MNSSDIKPSIAPRSQRVGHFQSKSASGLKRPVRASFSRRSRLRRVRSSSSHPTSFATQSAVAIPGQCATTPFRCIGGDVVNTSIRDYQKKFFSLYKSHTKSSSAGQELAANDIVPFWKRWPMIGAGLCFLTVVVMLLTGTSANPLTQAQAQIVEVQAKRAEAASGVPVAPAPHILAAPSAPVSGVPAAPVDVPIPELLPEPSGGTRSQSTGGIAAHPFDGLRLHIVAFLQSGDRWLYAFEADQNGQPVAVLTQKQLEESGYKVEKMSTCSARIIYGDISFFAVCDSPRISVVRTSS